MVTRFLSRFERTFMRSKRILSKNFQLTHTLISFGKGRVSGRAISFLAHHATTPLRNFKCWPTLAVSDICQVLCRMDIKTLQMLTLASSNTDPFERKVQRSFAYT
jgi:hypothetical protein